MAQAPADWYPDPLGRHEYRYWDGAAWTGHVADAGEASFDPLEAATAGQRDAGERTTGAGTAETAATDPAEIDESQVTGGDGAAESATRVAEDGTDEDLVDPYAVSVVHEEPRPVEQSGAASGATADDAALAPVGDEDADPDGQEPTPVPNPGLVGAPAYPATQQATDARGRADTAGRSGGAGTEPTMSGIRGSLIDGSYAESETDGPVMLQNERMLKVRLGDDVLARQGAMVAFQGSVQFDYEGSGSVSRMFKKALTNEGLPLMRCHGEGDVFLAHNADEIHLLWLDGGGITVSGRNVLAFHQGLNWDIQRVSGVGMMSGGLFNTVLSGTGWVAITTHGTPVVLRTDAPTFADSDAVVAWSSNLSTSLNKTYSASSFIGRGSGEVAQLSFSGDGVVIVQASEGPAVPSHSH